MLHIQQRIHAATAAAGSLCSKQILGPGLNLIPFALNADTLTTEPLINVIPVLNIQLYAMQIECKAALNKHVFNTAFTYCIIQLLLDARF